MVTWQSIVAGALVVVAGALMVQASGIARQAKYHTADPGAARAMNRRAWKQVGTAVVLLLGALAVFAMQPGSAT